MRNTACIVVVMLTVALSATVSKAEFDWTFDVMPGTILANFAADGFEVTSSEGEESLSLVSSVPNIAGGIAIEQPQGYIEAKLGAGMLLNGRLSTTVIYGLIGGSLEMKPSIFLGPHASLNYYSAPEWWGDADIEFDGTAGFSFGIHLVAGDKIAYLVSLDYMSLAFDVDQTGPGVTTSEDVLDMSGLAVQFGFRAQF